MRCLYDFLFNVVYRSATCGSHMTTFSLLYFDLQSTLTFNVNIVVVFFYLGQLNTVHKRCKNVQTSAFISMWRSVFATYCLLTTTTVPLTILCQCFYTSAIILLNLQKVNFFIYFPANLILWFCTLYSSIPVCSKNKSMYEKQGL